MEEVIRTIKCRDVKTTIYRSENDWRNLHPHGPITISPHPDYPNYELLSVVSAERYI